MFLLCCIDNIHLEHIWAKYEAFSFKTLVTVSKRNLVPRSNRPCRLNSLSPGRFDMFLKHRLQHVSCVNYYQNQFHRMRDELKLENGLPVSLFELYVS